MATTVTKSITLIPSGYTGLTNMSIDSSYGITRGYTNADNTQYTRFNGTASTTGYVYFTFDTSEIPAGATITSVTARGKARVSNTTRVSSTVMQLYTNTTAKGSNTAFASTTASVRTLSPGTWTRTELNNLRLRIGGTFSSSTSSKRIDFYGADVTVTYTVVAYDISASGDGTLNPSGTETVEGGESYVLQIGGLSAKPTVTDNNVDVTNQLTETYDVTDISIPNGNTVTGFTASNITNAYGDKDSNTYADLTLAGGSTTGTLYLDLEDINIPSGATIKSVSCQATLQFNRNNSTSGFTASFRMYAGSTAKGSAYNWISSGSSDIAKTTYTLTVGSWTASEINSARFYLTATNNASSTQRHIYVYGVSFSVIYESDGVTYVYTISNVSGDHTIVVTAAVVAQDKLWTEMDTVETLLGYSEYSYASEEIPAIDLSTNDAAVGATLKIVGELEAGVGRSASFDDEFIVPSTKNSRQTIFSRNGITFDGYIYSTIRQFAVNTSYNNGKVVGWFEIYKVESGGWVEVVKAYKKVNGSWVEQSDLTTVFSAGINYVKGN